MCLEILTFNTTKLIEMVDVSLKKATTLVVPDFRTNKFVFGFSISFCIVWSLFLFIVFIGHYVPFVSWKNNRNSAPEQKDDDIKENILDITPYVREEPKIINLNQNFLPDTSEITAYDDDEIITTVSDIAVESQEVKNKINEPEALTAMNMALRMKKNQKYEKAQKLFQHALALYPSHPDILNYYGEFLEEDENDIIKADHLYTRALIISPQHSRALVNRKRTLPVVNELDEKQLKRIDKKRDRLIEIPHNDPSLKRMKKEAYFQHIYHTVAIEGNTMTLAETRMIIETRMAVPGKSIMEHNEIIGLEAALRFINNSLVNKEGMITVDDILHIHKRVLGHADPMEAGCFRRTQVFVGEHTPPSASDVADLMEDFVEWLRSEAVLKLHPVKQAALAHYKLVYIHPFVDGNGRTARLLMNLILMRAGYPPVIIRKQDRSLYYKYLQIANEGDIRPFIRFIAESTEGTLDVYLYATEYGMSGVKALEANDAEQNYIMQM